MISEVKLVGTKSIGKHKPQPCQDPDKDFSQKLIEIILSTLRKRVKKRLYNFNTVAI